MRKYLPAGFLGRRSTLRTRRKETVYLSAASLRVFRLKLCDERPLALRFMFPLLCSSSATARPSNRQQVLSTARNTAGETCILGSDGCEAPRPGGRCANHLRRSAFVRLVFGRDHLRDSQKKKQSNSTQQVCESSASNSATSALLLRVRRTANRCFRRRGTQQGETCIPGHDGYEAPRPGPLCANHSRRIAFASRVLGRRSTLRTRRNSRTQRSKSASLPLQTMSRALSRSAIHVSPAVFLERNCASVEPPTGAFDGEEHSRGDVHPWA
jgi:hypothetical protein